MLAYGTPAEFRDDAFDVSETTAQKCLDEFCKAVVERFGSIYLRPPSAEDILRIDKQFRGLCFPGCIGAVDCAGWDWNNFPKEFQGIMVGKDDEPVLRLECICDVDLWCWHFQFGFPGSMNDINILNASDRFSSILSGAFPSSIMSYSIDNQLFNRFYYLADGIYPRWKIFIRAIADPTTSLEKEFNFVQEGVRKRAELMFGVLFGQLETTACISHFVRDSSSSCA